MKRFALAILLFALLPAGCARQNDPEATRAALMDADRAFHRATAARRAEGWMEAMAPDAEMIWPNGTVRGAAAIRERMAQAFADSSYTLTWEPVAADASEDLGYTVGRSEWRFRDAQGVQQRRTGRYLTVWKKQPDGSWKVTQDIGVTDTPSVS